MKDRETEPVSMMQRAAAVREGMATVARELKALGEAADSVARRLEALDKRVQEPAQVRRDTLNQVWDMLTDEGNRQGAIVVMRMISSDREQS